MSRWLVGSSSRRRSGLPTTARASSTRRFMPAERVATSASGCKAHAREDGLDLLVHAPAAVGLQGMLDPAQLGLQFVASLAGQPAGKVMVLGQQFGLGSEALGDLVEDRALKIVWHLLRQRGGAQPLLADDLAAIGFQGTLQEAEKRGLAGAIAAQEAHPFARLEGQVGMLQDRGTAEPQGDVGERNKWHPWMIETAGPFGKQRRHLPSTSFPQDAIPAAVFLAARAARKATGIPGSAAIGVPRQAVTLSCQGPSRARIDRSPVRHRF